MDASLRACVAFIAYCLISKRTPVTIYDYSQSKNINIFASIDKNRIDAYNYDMGCHIQGDGIDNKYALYHLSDNQHINLEIDDNSFKGYDYGASCRFNGSVTGGSILLYDHGESNNFNYNIL